MNVNLFLQNYRIFCLNIRKILSKVLVDTLKTNSCHASSFQQWLNLGKLYLRWVQVSISCPSLPRNVSRVPNAVRKGCSEKFQRNLCL